MSLLVGGMGAGGKLIITGIRKKTPKSISTYNSNTKPRKKLQYNHREVSAMILRGGVKTCDYSCTKYCACCKKTSKTFETRRSREKSH